MKQIFILVLIFCLFPSICVAQIPNDPNVKQWAFEHAKVYDAWDYAIGSKKVIVAIIDNGFDTFHPDLYDNAWKNEDEIPNNNIDDDKNGYIDDIYGWNFVPEDLDGNGAIDLVEALGNNDPRPRVEGLSQLELENEALHHGTVVAGIIGAVGNNEIDGAGINWRIKLMNIKLLDNSGEAETAPLEKAIRYAVDNGANIINISIVGSNYDKEISDAIDYAYNKGVAIFAAAGNTSTDLNFSPMYPVCSDKYSSVQKIIGVSAIVEDHHLANFSNRGSSCIDITAPGVYVSSTVRFSPTNGLKNRYQGQFHGTSFSTPIVSATAALIKSVQPTWGPVEIYEALLTTVHHTPGQNEIAYANYFGKGLVQVDKAIKYAISKVSSLKALNKIYIFNGSKSFVEYNLSNKEIKTANSDFMKDVSSIDSYSEDESIKFVAIKQKDKKTSVVLFFDSHLNQINSWNISSAGNSQILVGDVVGDSKLDVIIAPKYKNKQIFRVFSFEGKELGQYTLAEDHRGSNIALLGNKKDRTQIVAMYNTEGLTKVSIFSDSFRIDSGFDIDFLKNNGSIASGDIDKDGNSEIAIVAGPGDEPWVATYKTDGSILRKFWGFDPSFRGGISLVVGDYNKDGLDDLILAPKSAKLPIRVFGSNVREIDSLEANFGLSGSSFILTTE
jgi:hypothetical protein